MASAVKLLFCVLWEGGHQQIAKWESLSGQTNNMLRNKAFWEPEEGLQKIRASQHCLILPGLTSKPAL